MSNRNTLTGPKGHFLLGNFPQFSRNPLEFLTQCSREYREMVPLRFVHIPVYLLLNPEHIEHILSTHSRDFVKSRMYKLGASLVRNGLVMSEGDFWLRQRRLMQPAFHRERIEAYGQIMVDHTQRLLSKWEAGQILDINQEMMRLSIRIVTHALFNCDMDDDYTEAGEALANVFKEMAARFSNPIPIPENIPTPGNRRYLKWLRRLDEVIYRLIQQRRSKPEDTGDLLSMLLQAQDEDGNVMTDQQLRDEAVTIFSAGFESTARSMAWTWYLLSQHPVVEAKLMAELESVLGGRTPSVADLPNLKYTEMVFLESLRLYPVAPLLGREAVKRVEIGGYHFPKGTEFWIVPWVIHRNPHFYEAPEEFRPERWEGDLLKQLPKFAYFPFSGGARQCIGNAFATMEAKLLLATIAQRFHLELAPGEVVEPEFAITLRPKYGMKMMSVPRHLAANSAGQSNLILKQPVISGSFDFSTSGQF